MPDPTEPTTYDELRDSGLTYEQLAESEDDLEQTDDTDSEGSN